MILHLTQHLSKKDLMWNRIIQMSCIPSLRHSTNWDYLLNVIEPYFYFKIDLFLC